MRLATPEAGQTFEFSYPFVLDTFSQMYEDGVAESTTWKPGVRFVDVSPESTVTFADGIGQQIITVIATFKPGKYPERIFFTRHWKDPTGKIFGKGGLRITTAGAFSTLTRGYRYEFEMSSPKGTA